MSSLPVITIPAGSLQTTSGKVPSLFVNAGSDAVRRFIEFFTANIRIRNTRAAYAYAVVHFTNWCIDAISLDEIERILIRNR